MNAFSIFAAVAIIGGISSTLFAMTAEEADVAQKIASIQRSARLAGMKDAVKFLADSALECEVATDCVAIPMGHRNCGGPTSFVVTSRSNPSAEAVIQLTKEVTKVEKATTVGMMSICSIEMPPELACEAKICTASK